MLDLLLDLSVGVLLNFLGVSLLRLLFLLDIGLRLLVGLAAAFGKV